jgi:hypothetical protein
MRSRRHVGPDQQSRAGLVSVAAGLVLVLVAAIVLRLADGPAAFIGIVLAMWGFGGIAFGLAQILRLGA